MIKIEFPADRTDIALAIGRALLEVGGQPTGSTTKSVRERMGDLEVETTTTVSGNAPAPVDNAEPDDTLPETEPTDAPDVDHLGVAFDAEFCGRAKDPFYGSGKRKGQWKKRKGVDDAEYDEWYASQCEPQTAQTTQDTAPVNTGAAFGQTTTAPAADAPADCGALMAWASEMQVAGRLTAEDIQAAYSECGLVMPDLFPPNTPEQVAERVAKLYASLSALAVA